MQWMSQMKQVRWYPQYYPKYVSLAKCLLWKEAAGMVDDLRTNYKVLNQTCYNAMNVASKATATEKGLKGSCITEFISKNRVMVDIPPIITHSYFRVQESPGQSNLPDKCL